MTINHIVSIDHGSYDHHDHNDNGGHDGYKRDVMNHSNGYIVDIEGFGATPMLIATHRYKHIYS